MISFNQIHAEITRLVNAINSGGGGGGGGSVVSWNQITTEGEHIADITINGEPTEVYAPSGGGGDIHNYSTDEQIVGKWIDGSNIYEKTVVINRRLNSGLNNIPHGITGITNYISSEIRLSPTDNSFYTFLPHVNVGGLQYTIGYWYQTLNEFIISVGSSMVNDYIITLTVRYVK